MGWYPPPRLRFQHRYTKHIVLFLLTFFTTTFSQVFFILMLTGDVRLFVRLINPQMFVAGLWYSIPVLAILGAHEFGHYYYCRRYNVDATLPFFLPAPIQSGTFGAVIRIREAFPNRSALFDIGVAGPIAGFVVLVPFLYYGVQHSQLGPVATDQLIFYYGEPLLFKALAWLKFGTRPEGFDVMLHPTGFAAWWGMLATSLNLLPFGQLDGGHIAYAVLGKRARYVSLLTLGAVLLLTVFSRSWLVTAILLVVMTLIFGFRHPRPIDDVSPVGRGRTIIAIIAAIIFILCFTPVPVDIIGPK